MADPWLDSLIPQTLLCPFLPACFRECPQKFSRRFFSHRNSRSSWRFCQIVCGITKGELQFQIRCYSDRMSPEKYSHLRRITALAKIFNPFSMFHLFWRTVWVPRSTVKRRKSVKIAFSDNINREAHKEKAESEIGIQFWGHSPLAEPISIGWHFARTRLSCLPKAFTSTD